MLLFITFSSLSLVEINFSFSFFISSLKLLLLVTVFLSLLIKLVFILFSTFDIMLFLLPSFSCNSLKLSKAIKYK